MINMVKLPTNKAICSCVWQRAISQLSHSHINYYIDVTTQSPAFPMQRLLQKSWWTCLPGTTPSWILSSAWTAHRSSGTCLANELTKDGFANMNATRPSMSSPRSTPPQPDHPRRQSRPPWSRASNVADPGCFHHHRHTPCRPRSMAINYYGGTVAGLSAIFAPPPPSAWASRSPLFLTPSNHARLRQLRFPSECPTMGKAGHAYRLQTFEGGGQQLQAIRTDKPHCPDPFHSTSRSTSKTRLSSRHAGPFSLFLLFVRGTQRESVDM